MESYSYISVSDYIDVRDLAHGIKESNPASLEQASRMMAPLVPDNAVLIPVPNHRGTLGSSLELSLLISKLTNTPVDYGMSGLKRQSNYDAKLAGHPLKAEEMGFRYNGKFPQGKIPVFIDNVIATGETAKGVMSAFSKKVGVNKGFLLALGDDRTVKHNTSLINLLPSIPFTLRESKPTLYTMWKVDDQNALEKKYPSVHPHKFYHHSTVDYGLQSFDAREGSKTQLKVIGRLTTDKVDALLLEKKTEDKNTYPHITLATAEGVKPKESNTELEKNLSQIVPVNDMIDATFTNFFAKPKTPSLSESIFAELKAERESQETGVDGDELEINNSRMYSFRR